MATNTQRITALENKLKNSGTGGVSHAADPAVVRPAWAKVIWVGSVQPQKALDGDLWLDTTS